MVEKRITVWVQRRKDRLLFSLEWIDPETGRRKSKSAGTDDLKEAEQKRGDLEADLNNGRYQEVSKLAWDRFRQIFQDEYLPGLRERTREKYNTVLDVFEDIINPDRLRSISERTISAFVRGLRERKRPRGKVGLAPMSIKNYLISLKTSLSRAVEQKLLSSLPKFPTIHVPKKKPQPVPAESFERLLAKATDDLWHAYLLCGWWGGLRLSEVLFLEWEPSEEQPWVDLPNNRIVLPAVFAKSAQDQWVPLYPVLREALEKLPRNSRRVFPFRSQRTGGPLTRNGVTNRVLTMAKQAGVKLSMHRLRKGFGCRAAKMLGKGGAAMLHELMRHSSMQVTMDYYASVDDALQDAIRNLK
jgi:integrase